MIKNILFDMDDTILDFQLAEHNAIRKTFSELGLTPTDEICSRYSVINKLHWQMLERGEMLRHDVQRKRFEVLFKEYGINISGDTAQSVYAKYLSQGSAYIDGAVELLTFLMPKYDLYIASNGNIEIQKPRVAASGLAKYFKDIFISGEIGYDKPRVEFFDGCFAKMQCKDKDKTIIIGDSLTSDIKGGLNAGILTCHFAPHGSTYTDIKPHFTVASLAEIPALLEKL